MGLYFFDSSALVKRYAAEIGSGWVGQIAHPKTGNRIYLASVTGVEVISAIMKKVRLTKNPLPLSDAQKAIAEFRDDFDKQYEVLAVNDSIVQTAMEFPEKHKIRAYDAIQLAAALTINAQSVQQGIPATGVPALVMIASDADLLHAARSEGLATDDPRAHP